MKCFTIKEPDEMMAYFRPSNVKELLSPALRKRDQVKTAYLGFELFEGFSYNMFGSGVGPELYGYGLPSLEAKQTPHGKRLAKTSFLVLYDHTMFYLDTHAGDESRGIWMNHRWVMAVSAPSKLRLREIGTSKIYSISDKGKLTITIL